MKYPLLYGILVGFVISVLSSLFTFLVAIPYMATLTIDWIAILEIIDRIQDILSFPIALFLCVWIWKIRRHQKLIA